MYLRYLFESQMLPRNLRVDRGKETSKMATTHVFLLNQHGIMDDPTDSIIYGPSTSNKIERWWRELHERFFFFFFLFIYFADKLNINNLQTNYRKHMYKLKIK